MVLSLPVGSRSGFQVMDINGHSLKRFVTLFVSDGATQRALRKAYEGNAHTSQHKWKFHVALKLKVNTKRLLCGYRKMGRRAFILCAEPDIFSITQRTEAEAKGDKGNRSGVTSGVQTELFNETVFAAETMRDTRSEVVVVITFRDPVVLAIVGI